MALADLWPGQGKDAEPRQTATRAARRRNGGIRGRTPQDKPGDGLALGLAQAAALIPGVSRNGATLTAARARGFRARGRPESVLARGAARDRRRKRVEVMAYVAAWRSGRSLARARGGRWQRVRLDNGECQAAAPATVSTRELLPYAVYRCTIAAIAIVRLRSAQNRDG